VSTLLLAVCLLAPTPAQAQDVVLPREGMQYFATGLSLNPGLLYDRNADEFPTQDTFTASGGGRLRLGLHQLLTRNFVMSVEAELGAQWLDEHTATVEGVRESGLDIAWQLGVMARWLPLGDQSGFATGLGAHFFRMALQDAPLQVLGGELRIGKYFWQEDERFLLVELGYTYPLIQGLTLPPDFDGTRGPVERTWSFHRFSIGFQYGF
jgi:opacity protein-like surface antigen